MCTFQINLSRRRDMRVSFRAAGTVAVDVGSKFVPEELEPANYRRHRHPDQSALTTALGHPDDVINPVEQLPLSFSAKCLPQNRIKHLRLHTTGRALTARVPGEKVHVRRDGLDHAFMFRVGSNNSTAERCAVVCEGGGFKWNTKVTPYDEA